VANFDFAVFFAIAVFVLLRINLFLGLVLIHVAGWIALGSMPLETLYLILACTLVYIYVCVQGVNREWIYNFICVVALLNVLWQILQIFGIYWIVYPPHMHETIYVGLMGNPNDTSAMLAICLPAFFRGKWKWGIPVILLGLILAKAMVGCVAVGVVGLTFLRFDKKSLVLLLVIIVCVFSFAKYEGFSLKGQLADRGTIWKDSVTFAKEKPFGWGFGQYRFIMPLMKSYNKLSDTSKKVLYEGIRDKEGFKAVITKINKENPGYFKGSNYQSLWTRAHNEFIEVYFALGIIGLILCLALAGSHLIAGWRMVDKIPFRGVVASLTTATVFFSYHIMPLIIITVVYMAFMGKNNDNFRKL